MIGDVKAASETAENGEMESVDEDDLFCEIWERESQPELLFDVRGVGQIVQVQDVGGQRWAVQNFSNTVWEAAIWMHHFFQDERCFPAGWFRGRRVLELGAGTGLVGLTLALLGAEVTLTDLEEALPILQHNVDATFERTSSSTEGRSGRGTCDVARSEIGLAAVQEPTIQQLRWGNLRDALQVTEVAASRSAEGDETGGWRGFDFIVGADVIYNEATFPALLSTLSDNNLCSDQTLVYLATRLRGGRHEAFLHQLADNFDVRALKNSAHANDLRESAHAGEDWRVHDIDHHENKLGRRQADPPADASKLANCEMCPCTRGSANYGNGRCRGSRLEIRNGAAEAGSSESLKFGGGCSACPGRKRNTDGYGAEVERWSYGGQSDLETVLAFAARKRRIAEER